MSLPSLVPFLGTEVTSLSNVSVPLQLPWFIPSFCVPRSSPVDNGGCPDFPTLLGSLVTSVPVPGGSPTTFSTPLLVTTFSTRPFRVGRVSGYRPGWTSGRGSRKEVLWGVTTTCVPLVYARSPMCPVRTEGTTGRSGIGDHGKRKRRRGGVRFGVMEVTCFLWCLPSRVGDGRP